MEFLKGAVATALFIAWIAGMNYFAFSAGKNLGKLEAVTEFNCRAK